MGTLKGLVLGLGLLLATVTGSVAQSGYEAAISAACAQHGCDPAQLTRVMYCESGGNPNAVGQQGEIGLFQIKPWIWGVNAWDPYASIDFAARMFGSGQGYHWVCQ